MADADPDTDASSGEDRASMLAEAYKRGILPADMKEAYEEAMSRGLVAKADDGTPKLKADKVLGGDDHPRWDVLGDIGRAAEGGFEALKSDASKAFPGAQELSEQAQQNRAKFGPLGGMAADTSQSIGRMGNALKLPLDIAATTVGALASGIGHATVGSALSYLPGITKENADRGVDTAMMGLEPEGGGSIAEVEAATAENAAVRAEAGTNALKNKAVDKVNARFADDVASGATSAQDAIDKLNAAKTAGKPMTLMDVGGENVKGLAGNIARAPGPGKNMLRETLDARDKGAGGRVTGDINQAMGDTSAYQAAETLEKGRSEKAAPLYDEAYAANQQVESKELSQIVDTPAGHKALKKAVEKMQNDRTLAGKPDPELTQLVKEMTERGDMKDPQTGIGIARGLKLRTWDYVKRSLDDQISMAQRAGEKDDVRILTGMKNDLVGALDKADATAERDAEGKIIGKGKYAQARAAWSGPSQSREAIEWGKDFMGLEPEEIKAQFSKFSPNDKEFARLGVAQTLRKMVGKTGRAGDETRKLIGNDYVKQQLRPLFDDQAGYDKFVQSLEMESDMFNTKTKVVGNSQTAERLAEDHAMIGPRTQAALSGGNALARGAVGDIKGFFTNLARTKRDLGLISNPQMNAEVAKILTDPNLEMSPGLKLLKSFPLPATQNYLARGAINTINSSGLMTNGGPQMPPSNGTPPTAADKALNALGIVRPSEQGAAE